MDFVVVGEGEELVVELIAAYRAGYQDRESFLTSLASLEGVYVPERYEIIHGADGTVADVRPRDGAPGIVTKRRLRDVNAFATVAAVKTPQAEYGHMALLEVGKGCGRGCRFCLEGQVYRPVRHRSVDTLRDIVVEMARSGEKRVGLVGACVSDYPWIGDLLKIVEENGLELSISSLRADSLTPDLVAALARGGHRTLTMAPEAGTERLRRAIRKPITDEQITTACDLDTHPRHPQSQDLLHDRPADRDDGRHRGRFRRWPAGCSSDCACWTTRDGPSVASRCRSPPSFPSPGLRFSGRPSTAPNRSRRSSRPSSGASGPSRTCASSTRIRARRRCRRCWPGATAASPISSSWRPRTTATGGGRSGSGTATPSFYTTRRRSPDERLPWDHFDVGVKKAGLIREWERAQA